MSEFLNSLLDFFTHSEEAKFVQRVIVVVVSAFLLLVSWWIVKRIFRWIGTEDGRVFNREIRSVKLQEQELLNGEEISKLSATFTSFIRRVVNIVLFATFSVIVLTQWDSTCHIPEIVWNYLSSKYLDLQNEFIEFIPNLVFIFTVGFFTHFLIRIVKLIFDGVDRGRIHLNGFYQEWARPTFVLVRLLLMVFAFVIVFPYLPGSQSPALQGLSIFIGILVSLGSTSAITNIISGIAITYMRAFQTGDRVRIAETTGDIVEKSLLVTRIRTPKNVVISVPNTMVMNNHIVNYSTHAKDAGIVLHSTVTIGYDVPWRQVHELLIAAAADIEFLDESRPAFVLQNALGDFSVEYELNVVSRHPRKTPLIYSQMHQAIQDRFNEAGIEIMSPSFSGIRDANQVTIPEEYLQKDYQAQPFKFSQLITGKPRVEKDPQ
ncbi:mechanosensitive ion channel family protein [Rubritalea marina]|uniref:mechanosensitive ion channel family protein n=1 Tax=Rubritalea marina TaxID=361055 RepID=UPI00037DEE34|nr:mechanosensitive ion channel domain-containing protein [Rubritalea marina]